MIIFIHENGTELVSYVGKKVHWGDRDKIGYGIIEVQADGDELGKVLRNMENLPQSFNPVQSWFGDMAKKIATEWNFFTK